MPFAPPFWGGHFGMLIDQFGKYKASADGQIQFSNKAASDRMVAVAEELNAAG